jgi:hypothetical protein
MADPGRRLSVELRAEATRCRRGDSDTSWARWEWNDHAALLERAAKLAALHERTVLVFREWLDPWEWPSEEVADAIATLLAFDSGPEEGQ